MKKLPGKKKPPTLTEKIADSSGTSTAAKAPAATDTRKLPGLNKSGTITLKRGYTSNAEHVEKKSAQKLPGKLKPPTL